MDVSVTVSVDNFFAAQLPTATVAAPSTLPAGLPLQLAFGLCQLIPTYTGSLIRVSLASDASVQADIGIGLNGGLDEVALLAFASGQNVDVMRWYSQANGFDAIQNNPTARGRIVDNGTIYKVNNRPAIRFPGGNYNFDVDPSYFAGMTSASRTVAFRQDTGNGGVGRFTNSPDTTHMPWGDGVDYEAFFSSHRLSFAGYGPATGPSTIDLTIHSTINDGTTMDVYKNGRAIGSQGGFAFVNNFASHYLPTADYGGVSLSEYLIYDRAITTAERQAVEAVLSAYYGIALG